MGNVVDPEPLYPRTVSMTWTDPCDVEVRVLLDFSRHFCSTYARFPKNLRTLPLAVSMHFLETSYDKVALFGRMLTPFEP